MKYILTDARSACLRQAAVLATLFVKRPAIQQAFSCFAGEI